jgi:hypothetical protein
MDFLYLQNLLNVMIIISILFIMLHYLIQDFALFFDFVILLLICYIVDGYLLLLRLVFKNFG